MPFFSWDSKFLHFNVQNNGKTLENTIFIPVIVHKIIYEKIENIIDKKSGKTMVKISPKSELHQRPYSHEKF